MADYGLYAVVGPLVAYFDVLTKQLHPAEPGNARLHYGVDIVANLSPLGDRLSQLGQSVGGAEKKI
jgi:hypothetical protein